MGIRQAWSYDGKAVQLTQDASRDREAAFYSDWTTLGSTFPSSTTLQTSGKPLLSHCELHTSYAGESIWLVLRYGTHNMVELRPHVVFPEAHFYCVEIN